MESYVSRRQLCSRSARWGGAGSQHASKADGNLSTDVKHVFSPERMPFSLAYFGSLGLTLFFAVGVSRYVFVRASSLLAVGFRR